MHRRLLDSLQAIAAIYFVHGYTTAIANAWQIELIKWKQTNMATVIRIQITDSFASVG